MTRGYSRLRSIALAAGVWLVAHHATFARECEMAPFASGAEISLARPIASSVSREFGEQYNEATKKKDFNDGVDFEAMAGEPVYAAASGVVVEAKSVGAQGKLVRVDHGQGIATVYARLGRTDVVVGACIRAGEKLGEAGAAEGAAAPGFHFQVLRQGKPVDPLDIMN